MRVVWTSSNAAEIFAPKNGVVMENLDYREDRGAWHKYGVSKAGNVFHASEFARRFGGQGIVSVVSNYSFMNGLNSESGRFFFSFFSFGEKHCANNRIFAINRASIPAGSKQIYSETCPGG